MNEYRIDSKKPAAISHENEPRGQALIDDLLLRTSRTFALAIPLLPRPTRDAVALSYLLFRVADTFEDAFVWPPEERARALDELMALFDGGRPDVSAARARVAGWLDGPAGPPTHHEGYRDLLRALPEVLAALDALGPSVVEITASHVVRTARGMRNVVRAYAPRGAVRLETVEQLREYCYIVAGIVGELLTALFVHDAPSLRAPDVLEVLTSTQRAFGEGLQLVNILKDEADDAKENRTFLPPNVARAEILALARRDLADAETYVAALKRGHAPPGFLAFTGLPLELAKANLDRLERDGPGAKVPRAEVVAAFTRFSELAHADHSASAQSGK